VEVKRRRKSVEREDLRGEEQEIVGVRLDVNVNHVNARGSVPSVSLDVGLSAEPKNNFILIVNLI
tara:strand:- start:2407 stop:2601 length:195 start_codon:yes stop_codon:yes gene_type:complete